MTLHVPLCHLFWWRSAVGARPPAFQRISSTGCGRTCQSLSLKLGSSKEVAMASQSKSATCFWAQGFALQASPDHRGVGWQDAVVDQCHWCPGAGCFGWSLSAPWFHARPSLSAQKPQQKKSNIQMPKAGSIRVPQ